MPGSGVVLPAACDVRALEVTVRAGLLPAVQLEQTGADARESDGWPSSAWAARLVTVCERDDAVGGGGAGEDCAAATGAVLSTTAMTMMKTRRPMPVLDTARDAVEQGAADEAVPVLGRALSS